LLTFLGANPVGAIGHVGAALELAQQIKHRLLPEPKNIFLALGSGCTTAGLILGIGLVRKFGMGFTGKLTNFHIHAVVIHHLAAKLPFIVRLVLKKLIKDTNALIVSLGGPDSLDYAMEVYNQLIIHTNYAAHYGEMSPVAQEAKNTFDAGILKRYLDESNR